MMGPCSAVATALSRRLGDGARGRVVVAVEVLRLHPRHALLGTFVAGLCATQAGTPVILAIAALSGFLALNVFGARSVVPLGAAGAVVLAASLGQARLEATDGGFWSARQGETIEGRVVLVEAPRITGARGARARVRFLGGSADGEVALVRLPQAALEVADSTALRRQSRRAGGVEGGHSVTAAGSAGAGVHEDSSWRIGTVLDISGRVSPLGDWERYAALSGAGVAIDVERVAATGMTRTGLAGALDGVRDRARGGLQTGLKPPEAALLRGMVLGEDESVPGAVREDFRRSGLAHILAVSGQNVMLLAALVFAAGIVLGIGVRARLWLAVALIALYVPLTGAGPSIQRAGVMGIAGLAAWLVGRPASRWYVVALAAAATLAFNPRAIEQPGWQLSFAAVIGLIAGARPTAEALRSCRMPAVVAETAGVTLTATVATAPLLAHHFGELSLVSLPANLAAAPAVAPVMWLGMLAAAVAQLDPWLATPFTVIAGRLVGYIEWIAHLAAEPRAAVLPVSLDSWTAVAAVYLAIALVASVLSFTLRRLPGDGLRLWETVGRTGSPLRIRGVGLFVVAATAGAVSFFAWQEARSSAPVALAPGELRLSFLDVGQGDAILVQTRSLAMLVDTGPPDGGVVAELHKAGVKRLDVILVTHAEADHEGATLEVVRAFRPRLVLNGGAGWPTAVQRQLPSAVRDAGGGRIVSAHAGRTLRVGEVTVELLWPPALVPGTKPGGNPNDRAVVAHLRHGEFDALLPADAESNVLAQLELPRVEVLKVPHHGSDDPGLAAVLEQTAPAFAAIEVGRENSYGHPTPDTLSALKVVPNVVRTDLDGTVRLRIDADGMRVEPS